MFPVSQHDNGTGRSVQIVERDGVQGNVSYTSPLVQGQPLNIFATHPDNGREMAINAAFGGTPVKVHDGIDSALWTGSQIVGTKVTFDSTVRPYTGLKSVRVNGPSVDDVWQFDRGSDLTVSGYAAVTLFVNVDRRWTTGDSFVIHGWDTTTSTLVGTPVLLEDYFDPFTFDVWNKLTIPLADMGLTSGTIDAFRMGMVAQNGSSPRFYVDDFQIEQTTSGAEYDMAAPDGKKFLLHQFRYTVIDTYAGTVADGTMPGLTYNQLLGVSSLTSGISFTWERAGAVVGQTTIHDISDAVKSGASITNHMSDGITTSITILREFVEPIILSSNSNDKISIHINDDLSGLISLTAVGTGVVVEE